MACGGGSALTLPDGTAAAVDDAAPPDPVVPRRVSACPTCFTIDLGSQAASAARNHAQGSFFWVEVGPTILRARSATVVLRVVRDIDVARVRYEFIPRGASVSLVSETHIAAPASDYAECIGDECMPLPPLQPWLGLALVEALELAGRTHPGRELDASVFTDGRRIFVDVWSAFAHGALVQLRRVGRNGFEVVSLEEVMLDTDDASRPWGSALP